MDKKLIAELQHAARMVDELGSRCGVDVSALVKLQSDFEETKRKLDQVDQETASLRPGKDFEKRASELLQRAEQLRLIRDSMAAEIVERTKAIRVQAYQETRPAQLAKLEEQLDQVDREVVDHLADVYGLLLKRVGLMREQDFKAARIR